MVHSHDNIIMVNMRTEPIIQILTSTGTTTAKYETTKHRATNLRKKITIDRTNLQKLWESFPFSGPQMPQHHSWAAFMPLLPNFHLLLHQIFKILVTQVVWQHHYHPLTSKKPWDTEGNNQGCNQMYWGRNHMYFLSCSMQGLRESLSRYIRWEKK